MHPEYDPAWPPADCTQVQLWLNARVDGECTPAQEGWLADHLGGCRGCAREWARLEGLRLALETARLREPTDLERAALADSLLPSLMDRAGWILAVSGALLLGGTCAWLLFQEPDMPLPLQLGLAALGAGLLLLFLRVLWERMRVYRHDPYRHVQR